MRKELIIILSVFLILLAGFFFLFDTSQQTDKTVVRLAYFPNLLHAQALVGTANGDFQEAFGDNVELKLITFNAGPSAIEALFANEVDIVYIGPNPTINGYVKSNGEALKVISGSSSGGAVFVVRNDSNIQSASDLIGKKIATPQLGNTQDVALRAYIADAGLEIGEGLDKVNVIPTANPDILTLFQKKEIDGAWVPEPWGARLVQEAGGIIFLDERDLWPEGKFVTTNVIVNTKFLEEHPDLVEKFLNAHVEVTQWINENPEESKTIINSQIKAITGKELPKEALDDGFSRCEITYDPLKESLFSSAESAFSLGFLGTEKPDLSNLYDLTLLNKVLKEKNLQEIE